MTIFRGETTSAFAGFRVGLCVGPLSSTSFPGKRPWERGCSILVQLEFFRRSPVYNLIVSKKKHSINNGKLNWIECNLVWNHIHDFKIERTHNASSIWNQKYDFRPKLHDPKFNWHFIRSILRSHNLINNLIG